MGGSNHWEDLGARVARDEVSGIVDERPDLAPAAYPAVLSALANRTYTPKPHIPPRQLRQMTMKNDGSNNEVAAKAGAQRLGVHQRPRHEAVLLALREAGRPLMLRELLGLPQFAHYAAQGASGQKSLLAALSKLGDRVRKTKRHVPGERAYAEWSPADAASWAKPVPDTAEQREFRDPVADKVGAGQQLGERSPEWVPEATPHPLRKILSEAARDPAIILDRASTALSELDYAEAARDLLDWLGPTAIDEVVEQVSRGKGTRHGGAMLPFMGQRWVILAEEHGVGFLAGQAHKNLLEAVDREGERQRAAVIEALAYLGMALIWRAKGSE
jgi:hypothetical protein